MNSTIFSSIYENMKTDKHLIILFYKDKNEKLKIYGISLLKIDYDYF